MNKIGCGILYVVLFLNLSSCQTKHSTPQNENPNILHRSPKKDSSQILIFPKDVDKNAENIKVSICEKESQTCEVHESVREKEIITLPEGDNSIELSVCDGQSCILKESSHWIVKDLTEKLKNLSLTITANRKDLTKQLSDIRQMLTQLLDAYKVENNSQGVQSVTYLLSLNDSQLTYLLSDMTELSMEKTLSPSQEQSVSNSSAAAQSLLTVGYILSGISASLGFMGIMNDYGPVYVKKGNLSSSSLPNLKDQTGDRNIIHFEGLEIKLPSNYVLVEPKIDDRGNTKALGRGSQGSAFLVTDQSGKKKIIKIANNSNTILNNQKSKDALEAEFIKDDVDVANSMKGFENPMDAESVKVLVGNVELPAVMKDYVEGKTLKKLMEEGLFFDNHSKGPLLREKLLDLFERMSKVEQPKVYEDLNPDNLIYSESQEKWVVIDAKPPRIVSTPEEAYHGNLESFLSKLPVDEKGLVFSRDGIRVVASFAQYAPVYNDPKIKLNRDAQLMYFVERVKSVTYSADPEIFAKEKVKVKKIKNNLAPYFDKLKTNTSLRASLGTALGAGLSIGLGEALSNGSLSLVGNEKSSSLIEKLNSAKIKFKKKVQDLDQLLMQYWNLDTSIH